MDPSNSNYPPVVESSQQAPTANFMNLKCPYCERDLDGSFRTTSHSHCGLRLCASHLQELTSSQNEAPNACPRCNKDLRKEDFITTPSLSSSQRNNFKDLTVATSQQNKPETQPFQRMQPLTGVTQLQQQQQPARVYECPICKLNGLGHFQLLEHMKMHANLPGKCPICELKHQRDYHSKHLYGHLMLRHKDSHKKQDAASQQQDVVATGHTTVDAYPRTIIDASQPSQCNNARAQVQTANQTFLKASKGSSQPVQHQYGNPTGMDSNKMSSVTKTVVTQQSSQFGTKPSNISKVPILAQGQQKQQTNGQNHYSLTQAPSHAQFVRQTSDGGGQKNKQTRASYVTRSQTANQQIQSGKMQVKNPELNRMQSPIQPVIYKNLKAGPPQDQPVFNNQWLSQGLIGVFTFSVQDNNDQNNAANGEESKDQMSKPKKRFRMTSQYLSSVHKQSLIKRQNQTGDLNPFKLTELEKFLENQTKGPVQDHAKEQISQESGPTDDGLSSQSDSDDTLEEQDESTFDMGLNTNSSSRKSSRLNLGKSAATSKKTSFQSKSKLSSGRLSLDMVNHPKIKQSVKKSYQKSPPKKNQMPIKPLSVPVYLEEIERICFPESTPQGRNVTLEKESKLYMLGPATEKQSPAEMNKQARNVAQSPHQQNNFYSASKKFSVSPNHTRQWNQSTNSSNQQSAQNSLLKGGPMSLHDRKQSTGMTSIERQTSVPRFNSSVNAPKMMLRQMQQSPKGHHGTLRLDSLCKLEYNSCTLEVIEQFHKILFYTTRTADDKVQYLSVLVCAEPHFCSRQEQKMQADSQRDGSDAIISDEDDFDSLNGVKATLQPFILVIATQQPMFESAMGFQMLDFIYQSCFMPLYRRICFPSNMLAQQIQYFQNTGNYKELKVQAFTEIPIEIALSILFDVVNIFQYRKEDAFRQILWQDPLQMESQQLLQINSIFLRKQDSLVDCNLDFRRLIELIEIDNLIKLYSCLLLEKKIVLVSSNSTFQQLMAPIIECLLKLLNPLDSQVFTNISYTLSEEMVFYMEKPGSLIMGMPKSLWAQQGMQIFQQSFDNYIVVYDIDEKVFHLKNPEEPVGLPRTFSKLLRRSLSGIDLSQSDMYVSFQIRQAFLNSLLLMISYSTSFEETARDKKKKLEALIKSKEGGDNKDDINCASQEDSANSVQTIREGKFQFPHRKEFFKEFKMTTAFIDLKEKLFRKDLSLVFIEECLLIIEQQKFDWFAKLLQFQASYFSTDISHLIGLNQQDQIARKTHGGSILSSLTMDDILSTVMAKTKDKSFQKLNQNRSNNDFTVQDLTSPFQGFRIKKKQILKNLRVELFEQNQSKRSLFVYPEKIIQTSAFQSGLSPGQVTLGMKKTFSVVAAEQQLPPRSSKHGQQTPNHTDTQNNPQQRAPKTPDGHSQIEIEFLDEADAQLSSMRASRYSSTHKPQIDFNQIILSQSPRETTQNQITVEETKEDLKEEETKEKPKEGFFSLLTNFFSINKGSAEDQGQPSQIDNEQALKSAKDEIKGRKSSKSMQVMQPKTMSFRKPLDVAEVAKIKNLAIGLSIFQEISTRHQSLVEPIEGSSQNRNSSTKRTELTIQRELFNSQLQHSPQNHLRQETATFRKEVMIGSSASKHLDTAQFASSPAKASQLRMQNEGCEQISGFLEPKNEEPDAKPRLLTASKRKQYRKSAKSDYEPANNHFQQQNPASMDSDYMKVKQDPKSGNPLFENSVQSLGKSGPLFKSRQAQSQMPAQECFSARENTQKPPEWQVSVTAPAYTMQNSHKNQGANSKQSNQRFSETMKQRLSYPQVVKPTSPNSQASPFWSIAQNEQPFQAVQAKRLSLNSILPRDSTLKSNTSNTVTSSGAQQQKNVRTATINLSKEPGNSSRNLPIQAAQQPTTKNQSQNPNQKQADVHKSEENLEQSQSSQKLKITISKLQSKQLQSNSVRQSSHQQLYATHQQQSSSAVSPSLAQHNSQSALSFQKLQKQGMTMRNLRQCISPKILTKQSGTTVYQSNTESTRGLQQQSQRQLQQSNNNSNVLDMRNVSSTKQQSNFASQTKLKEKQLSQSSQNLKGLLNQQPLKIQQHSNQKGDRLNMMMPKQNGVKDEDIELENLTPGRLDERIQTKQMLDSNTHRSKSKKFEADFQSSQRRLISPRGSQSPSNKFKQRPKAHSQISREGALSSQIMRQANSNKQSFQTKAKVSSGQNRTVQNNTPAQYKQHNAGSSNANHMAAQSQVISSSQSPSGPNQFNVQTTTTSNVLHSMLKKGMPALQKSTSDNATRSHQKLSGLLSHGSIENQQQSSSLAMGIVKQFAQSRRSGHQSNSFVESVAASHDRSKDQQQTPQSHRQQVLSSHQSQQATPHGNQENGGMTSLSSSVKVQDTPNDHLFDSSAWPSVSRRQQQQLAQQVEGKNHNETEEQEEMENLQEILDCGIEGSRIRSISHQYPSQAAFLRASQDKMLISSVDHTVSVSPINSQPQSSIDEASKSQKNNN